METIRLGRQIRAVRLQRNLRQSDAAARADTHRLVIGQIELGRWRGIPIDQVERVAAALDLCLDVRLRSQEHGDLERMLDRRHAQLVGRTAGLLRESGWEVELERSFNHFGDRGFVDIVAWNTASRAVLIVEVKTEIVDLQELLGTLSKKTRVVPGIVGGELGWRPAAVGSSLVVDESNRMRKTIRRHAPIFDIALPGRSRDVARWLDRPEGKLAAIWFVPDDAAQRRCTERKRASGARPRSACVSDAENACATQHDAGPRDGSA